MNKIHDVSKIRAEVHYLYLTVDAVSYRIRWADCSDKLALSVPAQRRRMEVSPSGYGLHWPEIDEDLAITPLLLHAELLTKKKVRAARTAAHA